MSQSLASIQKNIIIIDDDEGILSYCKTLLSSVGYSVTTISDSTNCIEDIKNISADLLIVDIVMPQVNGLELVRELKINPNFKTPVLMFTGKAGSGEIAAAFAVGVRGFICKPLGRDLFLAKVSEAIGDRIAPMDPETRFIFEKQIEDKLKSIKKSFVEVLPEKFKAIASLLNEIVRDLDQGKTQSGDLLVVLLHTLSGPAGMHGLHGLWALAKNMEGAIKKGIFKRLNPLDLKTYLENWLVLFTDVGHYVLQGHDLYMPPPVAEMFEAAQEDLESSNTVIEDLIAGQSTVASFNLPLSQCSIESFVDRAIISDLNQPSKNQVKWDWKLPVSAMTALVYRPTLENIMARLIVSAKYLVGTCGAVRVRCFSRGEKSCVELLSKRETGSRVSTEIMDRIQVDLSIVAKLLEQNGGSLEVFGLETEAPKLTLMLPKA